VLQENIQPIGHKDSAFLRHLQIFSRFSYAIEEQREEMRKIIMIKVILGIIGVAHSKLLLQKSNTNNKNSPFAGGREVDILTLAHQPCLHKFIEGNEIDSWKRCMPKDIKMAVL
jgi:hypothetical protein